ncbi:arylesterase [Pseudooceanicola sp. C21-150M6]|uniref:arylesterase n=1 Tax=Pseudooceanicola sp. C21-150M6 TaxID=3434355 RepID=UPI003D7F50CC
MKHLSALRHLRSYGPSHLTRKAITLIFLTLMAVPAMAQDMRILALGDSLTQGYGLPDGEGFVPQLERWLAAHGHEAKVVNGGVSGDTTRGGLSRVEWSLADDIDAMIVTLGGNDILRGLDPAETRKNLSGILEAGKAAGVEMLLIGLPASGNYGAEYKQSFDANYPDLAEEYGTLYEPSFFTGLTGGDPDPSKYLKYMQGDGIHPNAEGVKLIVDQIGPRVVELMERAKGGA